MHDATTSPTPAAVSTTPTVTPFVEPHSHSGLSPAEAEK